MTLEDLRKAVPGFALYAFDQDEPMTLEIVFENDQTASFRGNSVGELLAQFFGEEEEPTDGVFG